MCLFVAVDVVCVCNSVKSVIINIVHGAVGTT